MPENFPEDAVIAISSEASIQTKLFRADWLVAQIKAGANAKLGGSAGDFLTEDGLPCEVLRPGMHWRSGKLHIKIKFVPGELPQEQSDQASDQI
jgi:hypothetical protein